MTRPDPDARKPVTARTPRHLARTAAGLLLTVPLLVATALPAAALADGEEPAPPLGIGLGLLLFLGLPLLIMAVTAVAVYGPSSRRSSRYRPAQGWDHQPLWFAGPDDPEAAVASASPESARKGGASASW